MSVQEKYGELISEAESVKFYRGAVLGLGQRLPATDAELDELLADLVRAKSELAFTRIVFAALGNGRRVDARHLVEGAALFPGPDLMMGAAWHCAGGVSEALVGAVKAGLMGYEREATALALAAAWGKEHPDSPIPAELITRARLLAREGGYQYVAAEMLMVVANLVNDEGLKSILKGQGVPEQPLLEKPFLEGALAKVRQSPMEMVPESPAPVTLSGFTVRRAVERVGRNDPCPCGSGKKYKKCCFEKDRERLLDSSPVAGLTQAELRQQPEVGLSQEGIYRMRSYELCRFDPEKLPVELRAPYGERLVAFGLLEEAVSALERWGWGEQVEYVWESVAYEVIRRGNASLLKRLKGMNPRGMESFQHEQLTIDLLLAGDEGRQQLDMVEGAALKAWRSEKPARELVELAFCLLDSRPALGIIAAHCAIPMTNPFDGETLLDELLKARDKLNLPPDDPMCDLIDEQLYEPEGEPTEEPEELIHARGELRAKAREMKKLQKELDHLHQELKKRERVPAPPQKSSRARPPQVAPTTPAEAKPVEQRAAALPESESKAMRERIDSLKSLLKERHNERNALRRELKSAQSQIEGLKQKATAPAATPNAEEAEEQMLESGEVQGKQSVRLPEFPRRFEEVLARLPQAAARSCLTMIGRLAAGEGSAFVGVKRLKSLTDVYRQRISEDYRLLFRMHPGRLEIVDLIHRRDLERKIKSMM